MVFFDLSIQKRKRKQKVKEYRGTADRNDRCNVSKYAVGN